MARCSLTTTRLSIMLANGGYVAAGPSARHGPKRTLASRKHRSANSRVEHFPGLLNVALSATFTGLRSVPWTPT